ncbi:MAG: Mur ligase family protein, partial [bacterium]|nr:Mur ligase family protein [bacterium]
AGSTWPGHLALENDRRILPWLVGQLKGGTILIAGTNGKTTTAKMVKTILQMANGKPASPAGRWQMAKVVHNEAGANLLNGIVSSLIMAADWKGKIRAEWGIFEVDEATLPLALKEFTPKVVVLMNLFRDQLDRYGEIDLIAKKWHNALLDLPKDTTVVLNGDDPQIAFLGKNLKAKIFYFGLNDPEITLKEKQHAMDTIYCPNCGAKLEFSRIYFSHLGEWRCPGCKIVRPKPNLTGWDWPLPGAYNRYNTLAAVLTGKALGVEEELIKKALTDFKPAFGRLEDFEIEGKKIRILLSKNPTGFNESIRMVVEQKGRAVLLVLNDRIPDGRDVSWIWDVDFEELNGVESIIASGDRAYDMGLRIKYALESQKSKVPSKTRLASGGKSQNYNSKVKIIESLREAIENALRAVGGGETLYILPTYSAMLEVRKILTGKKIL